MNDEDCRYVGTSLSTSCRGSVDAFARSLHRKFNSLSIDNHDEETTWYQNGHGRPVDQFVTSPLSPEDELPNPLTNGSIKNHFINPELFLNTRPIEFAGCDRPSVLNSENSENRISDFFNGDGERVSSSENYVDSSSVDDNYETASDLSADENEVSVLVPEVEVVEVETSGGLAANGSSFLGSDGLEDSSDSTENITPPKIRRCSSLKTGKTPPGTPGGKKIVRFADALGLDLADVKTYVDEIPKIPTSAYNDLNTLDDDTDDLILIKPNRQTPKSALVPLFTQPGEKFDFIEKIRRFNVCLETAMLDDPICCSIKGIVRVRNMDFHKTVFVRYSRDRWRTSTDAPASYVENSCDGFSDKFSFLIFANMLGLGDKLEFAVCFRAKGNEYWDNNSGANYVFECISLQTVSLAPLVVPPSWSHDNWGGAAFY